MKKQKRYVRRPTRTAGGKWSVDIVEGRSPLAPVVESVEFDDYAAADKGWQRIMRETGRGL